VACQVCFLLGHNPRELAELLLAFPN